MFVISQPWSRSWASILTRENASLVMLSLAGSLLILCQGRSTFRATNGKGRLARTYGNNR